MLAVFGAAAFLAAPQLLPHPAPPVEAASDAELYTGSIVLAASRQDICRRLTFDNRSGRMQDDGTVACGVTARADPEGQAKYWTHNIDRVRESFRKH